MLIWNKIMATITFYLNRHPETDSRLIVGSRLVLDKSSDKRDCRLLQRITCNQWYRFINKYSSRNNPPPISFHRSLTLATPCALGSMLPKSPAWRTAASGAPCSLPCGLKWGPADMHPFVLSPNSCTWNPCLPGVRPDTSPLTFTAPLSFCRYNDREICECHRSNGQKTGIISCFALGTKSFCIAFEQKLKIADTPTSWSK